MVMQSGFREPPEPKWLQFRPFFKGSKKSISQAGRGLARVRKGSGRGAEGLEPVWLDAARKVGRGNQLSPSPSGPPFARYGPAC